MLFRVGIFDKNDVFFIIESFCFLEFIGVFLRIFFIFEFFIIVIGIILSLLFNFLL